MALKVELKAGERILVGECVLTNGRQRTRFIIDGKTPILREKDILTAEQADTPAKRIYLAILLMYTARDPRQHHGIYFELVRDFIRAAPSARTQIDVINNHILMGDMYKALKQAKQLIAYEQELLRNEECRPGLRQRSSTKRQPA